MKTIPCVEGVGHAVNCLSLLVSLADVGVPTGMHDYHRAAQRMWTDFASTDFPRRARAIRAF
jgi:hypothetical protein